MGCELRLRLATEAVAAPRSCPWVREAFRAEAEEAMVWGGSVENETDLLSATGDGAAAAAGAAGAAAAAGAAGAAAAAGAASASTEAIAGAADGASADAATDAATDAAAGAASGAAPVEAAPVEAAAIATDATAEAAPAAVGLACCRRLVDLSRRQQLWDGGCKDALDQLSCPWLTWRHLTRSRGGERFPSHRRRQVRTRGGGMLRPGTSGAALACWWRRCRL